MKFLTSDFRTKILVLVLKNLRYFRILCRNILWALLLYRYYFSYIIVPYTRFLCVMKVLWNHDDLKLLSVLCKLVHSFYCVSCFRSYVCIFIERCQQVLLPVFRKSCFMISMARWLLIFSYISDGCVSYFVLLIFCEPMLYFSFPLYPCLLVLVYSFVLASSSMCSFSLG